MANLVVVTDINRTYFKLVPVSRVDSVLKLSIDIDSGIITPCMGIGRKHWYLECDILVLSSAAEGEQTK